MPLILLLLAVGFVFHFAWLFAALGAAYVVGRGLGGWLARRDDRTLAARARAAAIAGRADRQHAAVLAGDALVGVYGTPAGGYLWKGRREFCCSRRWLKIPSSTA